MPHSTDASHSCVASQLDQLEITHKGWLSSYNEFQSKTLPICTVKH